MAPSGSGGGGGFALPARHRHPRQFDRPRIPPSLRGDDIELMRVVRSDPPPASLLSADQMLSAINVQVHVKPNRATAAAASSSSNGDFAAPSHRKSQPLSVRLGGTIRLVSSGGVVAGASRGFKQRDALQAPGAAVVKGAEDLITSEAPQETTQANDAESHHPVIDHVLCSVADAAMQMAETEDGQQGATPEACTKVDEAVTPETLLISSPFQSESAIDERLRVPLLADPHFSPFLDAAQTGEGAFSPHHETTTFSITSHAEASPRGPAKGLEQLSSASWGSSPLKSSSRLHSAGHSDEEAENDPLILQLLQKAAISNRRTPSPIHNITLPVAVDHTTLRAPSGSAVNPSLLASHSPRGSPRGGIGIARRKERVGPSADSGIASVCPVSDATLASSGATARDVWVRDAVFDPTGFSNPTMAGLLTRAARQVRPRATIELPACSIIPPRAADDLPEMLAKFALVEGATPPAASSTAGGRLNSSSSEASAALPGPGLGTTSSTLGPTAQLSMRNKSIEPCAGSGASSPSPLPQAPNTSPSSLVTQTPNLSLESAATVLGRRRRRPLAFRKVPKPSTASQAVDDSDSTEDPVQRDREVHDGASLLQQDILFVTMNASPKPITLPGKEQMNKATLARMAARLKFKEDAAGVRGPPNVAAGSEGIRPLRGAVPASEALMAEARGNSMPTSLGGASVSGEETRKGYIPRFLRSKREALLPPVMGAIIADRWEVPNFTSTRGFEAGMETENGVVYYD